MIHVVKLYIIRHCKAEGQAPDAPLTPVGKIQANELAKWLCPFNIAYIFTSSYLRAVQTIEPFAVQNGLQVHQEPRFVERDLGPSVRPDYWDEVVRRSFKDPEFCPEKGESHQHALARAVQGINDILRLRCTPAAIVTHGNLTAILLNYFDPHFHFKSFSQLTNPDVYEVELLDGCDARVTRVLYYDGISIRQVNNTTTNVS